MRVTPVEAFSDNYIWLIEPRDAPGRVLVVDPGDAAPVLDALTAGHLQLAGILLTHHHPDHIGGVARLLEVAGAVPVAGPDDGRIPYLTQRVSDGTQVGFPELGLVFETWSLPGHTLSHVGYLGYGALFCGDTLFSAGCGRLFEGSAQQMNDSLHRIAALPPDTAVYAAHEYTSANLAFALAVEPANEELRRYRTAVATRRAANQPTLPSSIAVERDVNPFLRCERPTVRGAAERHAGRTLADPGEVFAVLRSWKDGFR
ncbi:MAG: hydroxyacylglutathione hydrolase [Gammaproteobacteria bacterium]|nr:hydroxyacylglutathione hydrolase [Gammaproteobacteria bacterium]